MQSDVKTCAPTDSLSSAAKLMWDNDCGCIPVVDREQHIMGVVTDRDLCMAAYFNGAALHALPISTAMSKSLVTCAPEDPIATAEDILRKNQIRRLPVVDEQGRLVGILSLNDIAREAGRVAHSRKKKEVTAAQVAETLADICQPRGINGAATAA